MSAAGVARGLERAPVRLGSSFRQTIPDVTWARARRLMTACGISRVTDITPMDRLGLPVFASVRPRGRVLRVHAGKGIRAGEARIGALMEAIEFSAAEPDRSRWTPQPMTSGELGRHFGSFRLVDLAPRFGCDIDAELVVQTVECSDVSSGRALQLPAELVFVPFELDPTESLFGWSTNGLASGNSCDEATLHGLFEVLERDALTMDRATGRSQWVDPVELPEEIAELASQWRRVGVSLTVRHVPNDFGFPCFEAFLHEPGSDDVDLAGGSGLHVDREIALARAICEAAQSRLTTIQGSREDVTAFHDAIRSRRSRRGRVVERRLLKRVQDRTRSTRFEAIEQDPHTGRSIGDVLRSVVDRLAKQGFATVLRYRFDVDLDGLHVVKVIVPKCESIEYRSNRVGPRLLAGIAAHA